jgi:hypothetical protein
MVGALVADSNNIAVAQTSIEALIFQYAFALSIPPTEKIHEATFA